MQKYKLQDLQKYMQWVETVVPPTLGLLKLKEVRPLVHWFKVNLMFKFCQFIELHFDRAFLLKVGGGGLKRPIV